MAKGKWTNAEYNRLVVLFNDGKSVDEISYELKRSSQAVLNKCTRNSLSFRDRDKPKYERGKSEKSDDEIPCLRCRIDFKSEGIFNRVCPSCARLNAGYVGVVPG